MSRIDIAEESNGYTVITDISLVDRAKWMSFVEDNEGGNIFHSPMMVDFFSGTSLYRPLVLFCMGEENNISGMLVAYVLKEHRGLTGFVSARAIVWGGPVLKRGEIKAGSLLLEAVKKELRGRVTYLQVRNLSDMSHMAYSFSQNGFIYEEHLDILFDLEKDKGELWESVHPTRRKQVRRALKRGVTIETDFNPGIEKIAECYAILKKLYSKIKLPFPDLSFFERAQAILGKEGNIGLISAIVGEKIIGFRFFLLFNRQIYDWYAASLPEYYDRYPNDILPWSLLEWGVGNNYRIFDFGGAGDPNEKYGVRDYKMKFGGDLVNYGRYTFVFRPMIYYPASWLLKTLRKKGK